MIKKITCPLDCYDLCQIDVTVEDGQIIELKGSKTHPLTAGIICDKGRHHLDRHLSKDRLKRPMKRIGDRWIEIGYPEALELIEENVRRHGREKIIHYSDSGYGGIAKDVDGLFFSCLGGVVRPRGSLCWSAGIQATKETFSDVLSTDPEQLTQAETIVLWGRNPADTSIHLAAQVMKEKKRGKRVVLIDPIETASASLATDYLAIHPNTDHYLALGILSLLHRQGRLDLQWIEEHATGFDQVPLNAPELALETVSLKTGLSTEQIVFLSDLYASTRVMTYVGYGLQRYKSGGNAVRCINAVSFATRNFGSNGRGINYAHKGYSKIVSSYADRIDREYSNFVMSRFGEFVLESDCEMLFVTKANPLVQLPNTEKVKKAFDKLSFKVGIDLFMTDTMKACDLVLPAKSIFEEEDVIYTSMFSPFLQYSHQVVENDEIIGEYELFGMLAQRLGLDDYPNITRRAYLEDAVKGALEIEGMTFEEFKDKGWIVQKPKPQYANMKRFVFHCELSGTLEDSAYPLRLITPRCRQSLHSQGFRTYLGLPEVRMSQATYDGWVRSERVLVESRQGRLVGKPVIDSVADDVIVIYEGYWHHSGAVNALTDDLFSDIGDQAAYYDTFVKVRGIDDEQDV